MRLYEWDLYLRGFYKWDFGKWGFGKWGGAPQGPQNWSLQQTGPLGLVPGRPEAACFNRVNAWTGSVVFFCTEKMNLCRTLLTVHLLKCAVSESV